jgi:DNA-binding MarR family transcriptional regulator
VALDDSDTAAAVEAAPRARGAPPLDASVVSHLVGYRLSRAAVPARRVFQRHVGAPLALRPVEFSLLMLLLANGRASPTQLAITLDVTPPKITALVDRLAERGLVRRQRSVADGRALDVLLTPEGRALVLRAQRIAQTMEDDWLAEVLSPAERAMLLELLGKLART